MQLKTERTEYYEVEYGDFDKFVKHHFPKKDYEFAADMESSNDTSHRFTAEDELDDYDKEEIAKWCEGNRESSWLAGKLLNYFCMKGKIPEGHYLIHVCW